jgi:SEC-C motif-containing protein
LGWDRWYVDHPDMSGTVRETATQDEICRHARRCLRPTTPFHHEPGLRWLGLQVIRHEAQGADSAVVEFVARSKLGGKAHRLRELSRFVREDGRWLYVEAIGP